MTGHEVNRGVRIAAFGAAAAFPTTGLPAAEISSFVTDSGNAVISVSGDIEAGDAAAFEREAARYESAVVALESDGGKTVEALRIAAELRRRNFTTLVLNGSRCSSSCGLIWLAGNPRTLSRSARVGFHAAYTEKDGLATESGVGNAIVGSYLTLLELPLSAVVFATTAPPNSVNWLDAANAEEVGIAIETVDDIQPADDGAVAESAPIIATADFAWHAEPWSVLSKSDRSGCFALEKYDLEQGQRNASALSISKSRHENVAVLSLRNEKFRSIVDGREYRIAMTFRTGGQVDDGWGIKTFTGIDYGDIRGILVTLDWEPLSRDMRQEESVAFEMDGKVVDVFPLGGSAEAMRQLDLCLRAHLPPASD